MKSILVPIGGGNTDEPVLETALAVARLLSAHLQFVHVRVSPGQAAVYSPGVAFARIRRPRALFRRSVAS